MSGIVKAVAVLFSVIVTHARPHLDEIFAIWLLRKFGEKIFPGISKAKLRLKGAGGDLVDGMTHEELVAKGILAIGVGGGPFDEHPGTKSLGKQDECATTLVAKALGIENDLALAQVIKFVKYSDLKGGNHPFDLASMVKTMHHAHPNDPLKVINWAITALDAKYAEQQNYVAALAEVEASHWEEIDLGGNIIKMVSAVSANERFNPAARRLGADVIVQQQPSGHVQIYTQKRARLDLTSVVQTLRLVEQEEVGEVKTSDWDELAKDGKVEGAEKWYYFLEGEMILNGSLSSPASPTSLGLERICQIVRDNITTRSRQYSRV